MHLQSRKLTFSGKPISVTLARGKSSASCCELGVSKIRARRPEAARQIFQYGPTGQVERRPTFWTFNFNVIGFTALALLTNTSLLSIHATPK